MKKYSRKELKKVMKAAVRAGAKAEIEEQIKALAIRLVAADHDGDVKSIRIEIHVEEEYS